MKQFMDKEFMLTNETAKRLFHEHAEKMPIIDYHCHINPQEIYEDRKFDSITQVWLGGDHYKWRAMRACGFEEKYVTGDADPREKFRAFAATLTKAVGNPLYHWSHLELQRYFGYNGVLNEETADEVYDLCNKKLQEPSMSVRGMIYQSNVKVICTTDDPADTLEWHKKIAEDKTCKVKVLPAWRPDKGVNIDKPGFAEYIGKLSQAAGVEIHSVADLKQAYLKRLELFDSMGCVNADHGMDYVVYAPATEQEVDAVFAKAVKGEAVTAAEAEQYKTALMLFFGEEYSKRGWVMQIHYGVLRNINQAAFEKLGPDTGFDAAGNRACAEELAKLCGQLESEGHLPKMIFYSINPHDNNVLSTIGSCFPKAGVCTSIQLGSGWWFNDTKTGMIQQLTDYANLNVLGNFIGMLTDSRSFLSYTRHEYFRRILCDLIGTWVENGEYPNDEKALAKIVEDISYNNTVNFFGFQAE